MNKKVFVKPNVQIVVFRSRDIISTSPTKPQKPEVVFPIDPLNVDDFGVEKDIY